MILLKRLARTIHLVGQNFKIPFIVALSALSIFSFISPRRFSRVWENLIRMVISLAVSVVSERRLQFAASFTLKLNEWT